MLGRACVASIAGKERAGIDIAARRDIEPPRSARTSGKASCSARARSYAPEYLILRIAERIEMSVLCVFCGNPTDFLTASQVARLLGVSREFVSRRCREGAFPGAVLLPRDSGSQGAWKIPATAVIPLLERKQAERSGIPTASLKD